uniref:Ymf68 n=1 Tax=Uronema marinum TaxID=35107 RepID=A0A345WJX1_UROMR|nr:ymf68 [Uronema marinum]AXJ93364.1 ymf68 [Uronema marinum]
MKGMVIDLSNNFKYFKSFLRLFYLPFFYIMSLLNFLFNSTFYNNNIKLYSKYYMQKKKWNFIKLNKFYFLLDLLYFYSISSVFSNTNFSNFNLRIKTRLKQVNWSFYNDLSLKNNISFNLVHYLSGIRYIWVSLKYWILGLILGLTSFYYLTYIRLLPFNKIIFEWILVIMFLYWLMSGFVFFIKKYQYSKFTSVIQRFWKRTYILFWLIESGVFLVFFYITLNAPEEPVYMYDQIKLFKTHLFSWRLFLIKLIPVISLIILSYYLILSIKWTTFSKQVPFIVSITLILIYVFWLEFYQFFHIINFYENLVWSFDADEFLWNLDAEFKRTRIVNNVVTICLLAKFWHLVFIFVFWIFFVLRINEIGRIRYSLLAANSQNFIILYMMSWLYMYPWLKFAFRRHLETQYYWYFYNARRIGVRVFFNDLILLISSVFRNNYFSNTFYFNSGLFYYWIESSSETNLLQYKKFIIRDSIINTLNGSNNLSSFNFFL